MGRLIDLDIDMTMEITNVGAETMTRPHYKVIYYVNFKPRSYLM